MTQSIEAIFYLAVIFLEYLYVGGFKAPQINLAYRKEISVMGQIMHPHEPSKAVDGAWGTSVRDVECAWLHLYKGQSYMQVDLGQKYRLGLIRILNAKYKPDRLHNLNITVYNDGEESVCTEHPGLAPEGWLELQCAHVIVGRHVRVTKTAQLSDLNDYLVICELEVYESQVFEFVRQHGYLCESYDIDVRSRSEMHCAMLCRETSHCMSFNTGISENSVQCQIITKNKCQPKRNTDDHVIWSYFTTM